MPSEIQEDWRTWTKQKLEDEYSPSRWSKRYDSITVQEIHMEVCRKISEHARQNIPCRLDISYDDSLRTKLDLFGEDLPSDSPIVVYLHGGYWQELDKNVSQYPVPSLYKNSILSAIVGFTLAPEATVERIVSEVQQSFRWVGDLAKRRGSKGVFLMGWCAGAQLITEALWRSHQEKEEWVSYVKGFISLAGIFDIRPIVGTKDNIPLHLTEETAWEMSPSNHINELPKVQSLIVCDEGESPEFIRQSNEYWQALCKANHNSEFMEVAGTDHFNLVEKLSETDYSLSIKVASFIKSAV